MKRMIKQPKRQSQVRSMQQASAHSIQRSGLLGPLVALVVMIALAIGVCLLGTSALGGGAPFSGVSLAWADDTNASSGSDNAGGSDSTAGSANAGGSDNADTSDNAGSSDNPDNSNRVYVNQLSDSSFLYDTSIADLSQADSYYEGQTVLVKGEVVGDRINDESNGDYCWITLQYVQGAIERYRYLWQIWHRGNAAAGARHVSFGMPHSSGTFRYSCRRGFCAAGRP